MKPKRAEEPRSIDSPRPEQVDALPEEGCVRLYCGDEQGKTAVGLGFVLWTLARGWPVLLIPFPGAAMDAVEAASIRKISPQIAQRLTLVNIGKTESAGGAPEAITAARDGWEIGKRAALSGKYRMILLDHVMDAVAAGWIAPADVREFLAARPKGLCLILTGRQAPPEIIGICDEAAEIRNYTRS